MKKRAFTLVEMIVVIGIIIIILALALPAASKIWRQSHVRNANQQIANLLKTAKRRSTDFTHIGYGLFFYVDPSSGRQVVAFVKGKIVPNFLADEKWEDLINRFEIDTKNTPYLHPLDDAVRLSPFNLTSWESEDVINPDYRSGKHRNFFGIIFQWGENGQVKPFILYDQDEDGFGAITHLAVGDVEGKWGTQLTDMLIDENDELLRIGTDWGFLTYDEVAFQDMHPHVDLVPYSPFYLSRAGEPIALERER